MKHSRSLRDETGRKLCPLYVYKLPIDQERVEIANELIFRLTDWNWRYSTELSLIPLLLDEGLVVRLLSGVEEQPPSVFTAFTALTFSLFSSPTYIFNPRVGAEERVISEQGLVGFR